MDHPPPAQALLELAATLSGEPLPQVQELAAVMGLPAGPGPWQSTLNNDGSPLQLCLSLGQGRAPGVRLLVDPAAEPGAVEVRAQQITRSLDLLLAARAPTLRPVTDSVLSQLLPREATERAALPGGGAWLAANLSGPGMALYVTARWGDQASRWQRGRRWLSSLQPESDTTTHPLLERLASHASLVSAGIEGVGALQARAKFYWRLTGTASLASLGLPLVESGSMANFLNSAIGDRQITRSSIVGSVSFSLGDGGLSDVKLDLCGHCVPRSWPEWSSIVRRCAGQLGLDASLLDAIDRQPGVELAFIGLGLDRHGAHRLNLYLKSLAA